MFRLLTETCPSQPYKKPFPVQDVDKHAIASIWRVIADDGDHHTLRYASSPTVGHSAVNYWGRLPLRRFILTTSAVGAAGTCTANVPEFDSARVRFA